MTTTLQVRVEAIRREATDILSFDLGPLEGGSLPGFTAGAHLDVFLPGLPARQYSLCNPPFDTGRYQIAVLKEPKSRGGSRHLHEVVRPGDVLTVSVPRNHFTLAPDAGRSLLLAGGIGVTPLLAMAEALAAAGADWQMHYCCRSRDRMAFRERLSAPRFDGRVHLHPDDESGPLDLSALLANRRAGDHLYICGPTGFLDWVRDSARAQGWPEDAIHTEYFQGSVEHRKDDAGIEIEVAETGQIIPVAPDQTVLDALLTAGLDIPNSCTEGVCGMCMTRVVDGSPDHRDQFLTQSERQEGEYFMPCCSRATTHRLVISCDY